MKALSTQNFNELITRDNTICNLYAMHLFEFSKGNILSSYAYFKSFFDRISSYFNWFKTNGLKKPTTDETGFFIHNESKLRKVYKDFKKDSLITETSNSRNENPLVHASSGLIDKPSQAIIDYISKLNSLMIQYSNKNGILLPDIFMIPSINGKDFFV